MPVQRLQVQLRHMISHQRAYIGLQGTRHPELSSGVSSTGNKTQPASLSEPQMLEIQAGREDQGLPSARDHRLLSLEEDEGW